MEIRDGAYGYSPEIGKYCGYEFPPVIKSSGSALWLRFKSDENIEYSGFRIVYSFEPRKDNRTYVIVIKLLFKNYTKYEPIKYFGGFDFSVFE